MQTAETIILVLMLAGLICVTAPILLTISNNRAFAVVLAILLTGAAVAMLAVKTGFGDTMLVAAAWVGAMICGLAAYIDRAVTRNSRASTYRLLANDPAGLEKPRPND